MASQKDVVIPPPFDHPNEKEWRFQITLLVQSLLDGKSNSCLGFTIAGSTSTTTIIDSRIGELSCIFFTPLSEVGASLLTSLWTSTRTRGSAILTHDAPNEDAEMAYLVINGSAPQGGAASGD